MAADVERGVSRAQAVYLLKVSPATVSMWALRGWDTRDGEHRTLTVVGKRRGHRLYRYGDLVDAESDTRNNPNSRRGTVRVGNSAE